MFVRMTARVNVLQPETPRNTPVVSSRFIAPCTEAHTLQGHQLLIGLESVVGDLGRV